MEEYCKGIIYASKVRQNSISESSLGDFKIDCFIIWVCVLFQLFYSVTVDSFWQFRINSFLGCALVLRGRRRQPARYPVSTWHGWLPRDTEVYTVHMYSGAAANATWHPACLTKKQLSLTDIYCAWPGLVVQTRDGHHHQWTRAGAPGEAEAHTSHSHQQIRSAAIID